MNGSEAPQDDADVIELFRERDSLGANTSLWLRAFRQLTSDGKPIGRILAFVVPIGNGKQMPIAMLTLTERDRLVFWPVLPRKRCDVVNKSHMEVPDHITVEFPSEKVHATSYGVVGERARVSDAWRSASPDRSDLRLLFTFFVRISVLEDQDVLISRKFMMPNDDKIRRTKEFVRSANNVVMHDLPLPNIASDSHFIALALYRTSEELTSDALPPSLIPMHGAEELVDCWPNDAEFETTVAQFQIRDRRFLIVVGNPPGQLKEDLCFGFPRRTG